MLSGLWRWRESEVSRYTLWILFTALVIICCPNTHAAKQLPAANQFEQGSTWAISAINPVQKTTTSGHEVSFDIQLINLTGSRYQRVEVSLTPTIPGHKGWFSINPAYMQNVQPQQGFRVRISITPTYQSPEGVHNFYTSVTLPGDTPVIIKNGPRLRVIRKKEGLLLHATVPHEILITVQGTKRSLRPLLERLKRSYRLEVAEITELKSLEKALILLRIPDGRTTNEIMEVLSQDPQKITPQPNYIYRSCGTNKADPLSDLQYALKALHADQLPSGIDGRGVSIAVIDTGVDYLHPDLKGLIAHKKDVTGNGSFQLDLHGTALAGIIAAHCKNGIGICGLAPGVDIVSIKACRPIAEGKISAMTTSYWLSQGIDYAIVQEVRVINLSLGGPKDTLIRGLVEEAYARDIVIVAAAGDKGLTTYPPYPAALPEVIAVAAVDIKGKPYAEGIEGDFITICAPGVDIMTTAPGDKYNFFTGTSMAAAYVTGAVALLLQKTPHLKPQQVRSCLEKATTDLGAMGIDKQFGWGLIDVKKLCEQDTKTK
jgi:subtilisin family serine protease